MPKRNGKRTKRAKNLIVTLALTAVIFSVSTYAWFIGMRTVSVSSFDVEIAATDSLLLSLNGSSWDSTVAISKETYDTASYDDNTNSWGGRGLIPVSSVGAMDNTASRMKIFEKASLTATPGGYRLLSSRVDNFNANQTEQSGYVAFDLFVKNFSGTQYIKELNTLDEEAIYLTTDSTVTVATGGVAATGIENSVRVAFAQIGRVAGTTTIVDTITGINCSPIEGSDVTGICRTAQIWEPNDKAHVANAISWYNTSCKSRVTGGIEAVDYNTDACGTVIDTQSYPTYAVSAPISSAANVDIYDGAAYNGYTGSNASLTAYSYFTDSMKAMTGTSRPTFMTLSPNSITKIRVYIYIEGQDVDNYDFASIGKKIAVQFGFTKERYNEDDISYTGPDFTAPVLKLVGESNITLAVGDTYTESGATAMDNVDLDITDDIVTTGTVDTATAGTYTVTYTVTDVAYNTSKIIRTIVVK